MKFLSVDSSSPVASVALVAIKGGSEAVLFEENTAHARSDSSALFNSLESAIRLHGVPNAVCVGLGPGSYNGLRVSIAAARAMATSLDLPLHALPSPLAIPGPPGGFWVAGDARGGHLWAACVQEGVFLEKPLLMAPDAMVRHFEKRPDFPVLGSAPLAGIPSLRIATPSAFLLAGLAHRGNPLYLSPQTPEPLYLKPPHITVPNAAPTTR
jgi:tRNA threonylcarbamoyladenosine biosynthesis protein TsaB